MDKQKTGASGIMDINEDNKGLRSKLIRGIKTHRVEESDFERESAINDTSIITMMPDKLLFFSWICIAHKSIACDILDEWWRLMDLVH